MLIFFPQLCGGTSLFSTLMSRDLNKNCLPFLKRQQGTEEEKARQVDEESGERRTRPGGRRGRQDRCIGVGVGDGR